MNKAAVRVRFAPSPTGFLHVGGARTALFNWLFARHHGGAFVLRIEDTDRARSDEKMTGAILDGLTWLGIDWDEGPLFQADGLKRHQAAAAELLEKGSAYRCFCKPGALETRKTTAGGDPKDTRYDRHCLERIPAGESDERAAAGEPFAVRFCIPEGVTAWDDAVHGNLRFANADIEDFVVLRTDGTPIYNMAVVSDDVYMGITHVIRGDDHISNTPKQVLIYRALGAELPVFGHVPTILGSDGKRLSKRHGATAIGEYRNDGILPEAMVNFLALLGWSPGTDQEIFSRDELIARFSLDSVNRKSAVFDPHKLWWMNGQHIGMRSADDLIRTVGPRLVRSELLEPAQLEDVPAWLPKLMDLLKARARTLDDMVTQAAPYLRPDFPYEEKAAAKHWSDPSSTRERLLALRDSLARLAMWSETALEDALRSLAADRDIGAGKLIHPLRVALLGVAVSPGIFEVAEFLGKEEVLRRIDRAVRHLRSGGGAEASTTS